MSDQYDTRGGAAGGSNGNSRGGGLRLGGAGQVGRGSGSLRGGRGGSGSGRGAGFNGGGRGIQEGDWPCVQCGASNFARRIECFRCHAKKDGSKDAGGIEPFEISGNGGGSGSSSSGGSGGGSGGGRPRVKGGNPFVSPLANDLPRFLATLSRAEPKDLTPTIHRFEAMWLLCWRQPQSLPAASLGVLLAALSRLPASSDVDPPAISEIENVFDIVFDSKNRPSNPDEVVKRVEMSIDVVNRLQKFLWREDRSEVKGGLENVLSGASSCLAVKFPDHRKAQGKINDLLEQLEKPWTIKVAEVVRLAEVPDSVVVVQEAPSHYSWRDATVGWLANSSLFNPFELPKMHIPGGLGNGTYQSPEEYFDTVFALMVAITFEQGNQSLSPVCRMSEKNGECGKVLRPCSSFHTSSGGTLHCMGHGCSSQVVLACSDKRHNRGLCSTHANQARSALLAGPSNHASTHIYDGFVAKVSFDGRVFLRDVLSRRPPVKEIHWRTTRRLQSPNLVGLVKLNGRGAKLNLNQTIVWAEIVEHSRDPRDREDEKRKNGFLACSILQLEDVFNSTGPRDALFQAGDFIAVIDCQSFVPEQIPVLKALELQRNSLPLPFQNGALLNISAQKRVETAPSEPDSFNDIDDNSSEDDNMLLLGHDIVVSDKTRLAVETLVHKSFLDPIIQIRRHAGNRRLLENRLMKLVESATLDEGQFDSFVGSLMHPVHCTQGPPGTGKSYLGVVIARALLIIRELWIKTSPSVSAPPILVLSYKNHAIDEFLCDLVAAEPFISLIRIGSIKDERLRSFAENTWKQESAEVKQAKATLERLHELSSNLESFYQSKLSFGCTKDVIFGLQPTTPEDERSVRQASYDATSQLAEALAWLAHFSTVFPTLATKVELIDPHAISTGQQNGWVFDYTVLDSLLHNAKNKKVLPLSAIQSLFDGIRHYNPGMDSLEVLYHFIMGFTPQPLCYYPAGCSEISEPGSRYCLDHQCVSLTMSGSTRCMNSVVMNKSYCQEHACFESECQLGKLLENGIQQNYCDMHACRICVSMGFVADIGNDEPPRNTCDKHPLCTTNIKETYDLCSNLTELNSPYCVEHAPRHCQGLTKRGNPCTQSALSKEVPFCNNHVPMRQTSLAVSSVTQSNGHISNVKCQSLTAKGKPCKGNTAPGAIYCPDHSKNPKLQATNDQKWEIYQPVVAQPKEVLIETIDVIPPPAEPETEGVVVEYELDSSAIELDDFELVEDAEPVFNDNPDELEEAENIQHLREVFEVGSDTALFEMEEPLKAATEPVSELNCQTLKYVPPGLWEWNMSLDERWNACQSAIDLIGAMKAGFERMLSSELEKKKREYHHADVRARSKVYEGKSVIGGTIVGCISRLDAIRVTNPFAIIVEEASEVLEPLLFACLGTSTAKLELVGDHFQLQPSMMNKFEFERINKMNMSLFERLIRAPTENQIPQSVLSIQRRMRPNIADLTREFYAEITSITDHAKCLERRIGDDLVVARGKVKTISNTDTKGWLVPGISSNVFFWTHDGKEERAAVGLSKVNHVEAKMCNVVYAIITPYKGQLMEIRKTLEKPPFNLVTFKDPKNSVVLSTVDRFQGDESDIIIASLVIDSKSTSPFVKQQNRMIVLNSRARIGFYIVGNPAYFDRNPVSHWKTTIDRLIEPAPLHMPGSKTADELVWSESRLGRGILPNLPVVSPCANHPTNIACSKLFALAKLSSKMGLEAARENFNCDVKVELQLPCTHTVKLACSVENSIASGVASFPTCTKPALTSFIHPLCKHEITGNCNIITGYSVNPTSAPNCIEEVEYTPPCGHSLKVKCYLKHLYEQSSALFVCPSKVEIELPRCGHSTLVSCQQAVTLQTYFGIRVSNVGEVIEGTVYGPKDATCAQKVEFIRVCGHNMTLTCEKAFSLTPALSPCNFKENAINPSCGHAFDSTCSEKRALEAKIAGSLLPTPVAVVKEGDCSAFGSIIINHKCLSKIKMVRRCGHEEIIYCCDAKGNLSPCQVLVSINSPLCGHSIKVSCSFAELGDGIWSVDAKNSYEFQMLQKSVISDKLTQPNVNNLPDAFRSTLLSCTHETQVFRSSCSHSIAYTCKNAFKLLMANAPFKSIKPCVFDTVVTLSCGHSQTVMCVNAKKVKACIVTVSTPCWNFSACSQTVNVICGSTDVPCCESFTVWSCPVGHSFDLAVCFNGIPSNCPKCIELTLQTEINAIESESQLELDDSFVTQNFGMQMTASAFCSQTGTDVFIERKLQLLNSFKGWVEELPTWGRPLFSGRYVSGFITMKKQPTGLVIGSLATQQTYYGVMVRLWTPNNLQKIFDGMSDGQSTYLLLVSGYIMNVLSNPSGIPNSSQQKGAALREWHFEQSVVKHHDAMQLSASGFDTVVFWTPFCMQSTGYVVVTKADLKQILLNRRFPTYDLENFALKKIEFKIPVIGDSVNTSAKGTGASSFLSPDVASSLDGTLAEGCSVYRSWDGVSIGLGNSLLPSVQKELRIKLSFILKAAKQAIASPFAGLSYLESLRETFNIAEFSLIHALELCEVGSKEDAEDQLVAYIDTVRTAEAHPLLLLAVSRIAVKEKIIRITLLRSFLESSTLAESWLLPDENVLLSEQQVKVSQPATTPREMWNVLKQKHHCKSEAMEELIDLVGLTKVKVKAIELFKTAIGLQKMAPDIRKANMMALNYSFYGNPGTGKTTVARLFAKILKDSGMRSSDTFIQTSARKLKDEGADKFMSETVPKATNGVLFIDEAYTLSPIDDPKGREIVNELLLVTEDMRDKISVIIAGYEDDLNDKFFAFNDGLKSRFQEIVFEDFDQPDLLSIWYKMVIDRGWTADDRIGPLVTKKLAKMTGRKGFGNARAVRAKFEEYTKRAFSRESYDGEPLLILEDVIGESPLQNQKLKNVLAEFEERIGWVQVKKTVNELVSVCEKNYERELNGLDASPVILNRLFLGNPGTGKTTCAQLYGRLLKHLNFLSKGEVTEATASDLIGSHVGESQRKTNAMLEKARGNVLLIDEAYNLDDNHYGKQVLDVLVEKVQGSENDDIAVLLCGYDEPMLKMLRTQNPGLSRRFPREYAFEFADYTDSELLDLFNFECRKKRIAVESFAVKKRAIEVLSKQRNLPNFGNAGAVKNLLVNAISKASARQTSGHNLCLKIEDFGNDQPAASKDPLEALNKLYRIDKVKQSLIEIRDSYAVALKEGGELPNVSNFVFTGSPGTGKTTVARVMAQVLFEMGILSTNRLVETSGLGLTGEFVGHTKKRVEEKLGEARGGVLFIDEAYELGKGHFADEALTSIVAAMTNPMYKGIVIIIAGYTSDINDMLNANAGLKSRFTNYFEFEDWKPEDCYKYFSDRASEKNFVIQADVQEPFLEGMKTLIGLDGWGNGRDVTKLWEAVLIKRSSRVVANPEPIEKTITLSDVQTALDTMISPRKISSSRTKKSRYSSMPLYFEELRKQFKAPPPPQEKVHMQEEYKKSEFSSRITEIVEEIEEEGEIEIEEKHEVTIEEYLNTPIGKDGRDSGVSDEVWAELEESKQRRRNKLEKIRKELEEIKRLADERERERLRQEMETKIRAKMKEEQAVQEKIRRLCPCPVGFSWFKAGNGWRCGGGSHFVSDAKLRESFMV